MGSLLVDSSEEHADTVWSLGRMARLSLTLLRNFVDHSFDRVLAVVAVPVVERLVAHEFAQEAGVRCQPRENHSHMIIDVIDLLLMSCQVIWCHFQSNKYL